MMQYQRQNYPHLYFCQPGQYQVHLSLNISRYQSDYLQIGMPQQQLPSVEYGNPRQFGQVCVPFNNNGGCFPRPESSSSILDESSYSSGLSTPGIISESWSYATPQQIYPHPTGQQFNIPRYNQNPKHPFAVTSSQAIKKGKTSEKATAFSTSTPTKDGCFSGKRCTIN